MEKISRQTRDPLADPWGARTPYFGLGKWPERVDERSLESVKTWQASVCGLCAHGCAADVGVSEDGRVVGLRGRADGPNKGRLGPKGLCGFESLASGERLTRPLIRRHGKFKEAEWDEAMELVSERMLELSRHFTTGTIGFYAGGELSLEEQYALAVLAKGGVGTPHVETSARLHSEAGSAALRESFGADGQAGRFDDLDLADCVVLFGHDMAAAHTVLWSRLLDRRQGAHPPRLVVVDPLTTECARAADVHLAPRAGTNVALLNGLIRQIDELGGVDEAFVARCASGFDELLRAAAEYPAERVEQVTGVSRERLREAARLICESKALVSTVHAGIYESHQATAAACLVNDVHILRGMLGRAGAGVLHMEEGANEGALRQTGLGAALPCFLNPANPDHVERVAEAWNVEPERLPTWVEPTRAGELMRLIELGSLRMLYVAGANPAVSWPDLHRVRRALSSGSLFLVVSDAYMSETASLADVVLPAAPWTEKEGCMVSADRTVRLARKAVEPKGQARSDFEIIVDLSKRLDLRGADAKPLLPWREPRQAFEAFRELSEGTACGYYGVDLAVLEAGGTGRWGPERRFDDGRFPTGPAERQGGFTDLETGGAAALPEEPNGRALLRSARWLAPFETGDGRYPLMLVPGRLIEHAGTRQMTGRTPELSGLSSGPAIRISEADARKLGVKSGDLMDAASPRGTVRGPAVVGGVAEGCVFIPSCFGYFDKNKTFLRAVQELTSGECDPVSGQPSLSCAVQAHRAGRVPIKERLGDLAAKSLEGAKELADRVASQAHWSKAHVADYLWLAVGTHQQFAESCEKVSRQRLMDQEIRSGLRLAIELAIEGAAGIKAMAARYGEKTTAEPRHLLPAAFHVARSGEFGLLRDLHDLKLMACEARISVEILQQGGRALGDAALVSACERALAGLDRQSAWLTGQLARRAGQTLTVPS